MKLYRIKALLLKYWYMSISGVFRMFDIFYWPVLGIIVFGFTALYIRDISSIEHILLFLMGGLILWTIFERMQQDVGVFIMEDFWSHNIGNLFITPVKSSELFIALAIVGFVRACVSFLLMYIIAITAYHFNVIGGNASAMAFVVPLLLFGWALGIIVSGIVMRYGPRVAVLTWSISYLLQPVAAVYYPLSTLPPSLQKVALFTPLYYTFEGFRQAYNGVFSVDHFVYAVGLSIIYLIIGFGIFDLAIRAARKRGLLAQY